MAMPIRLQCLKELSYRVKIGYRRGAVAVAFGQGGKRWPSVGGVTSIAPGQKRQ